MTGTEIIDYYNRSRFVELCGIKFEENLSDGSITSKVEVMPMHMNGSGHIHGGMLFTIADSTGGANSRRYADRVTTLDSDFHFLTSKTTRYLYGSAELIRNGGKIIVLRVFVKDDNGETFAEGTFTYYKL
ncbi:PaaI family thioesterase [Oribacterium sp. P6A1]|uniref:PaaI family thioesterase n=1 Tax=Oribacterium sp. P6A1 TaxID=1410612 RepID=UPI0005638FAF|nr:PaaI family thioesterase [Oribacterium sp. P6A1]MBP3239452.1 PaaI family thioesterase [Oribacterium sp.]